MSNQSLFRAIKWREEKKEYKCECYATASKQAMHPGGTYLHGWPTQEEEEEEEK